MGFKGLSNAVTNTHPLLPSMGTTRQKSSCRNGLQNGPRAETGAFRTGPLSLPSTRTARSRTSPGRVSERRTLPLWDLGREVLSKNAESLRDSDALMRVAVPRRRGPAGLRSSSVHLQNRQDLLQSLLYYGTISLPVNG